jgi:iron-sulfur cluster assembly accessory protein
MTTVANHEPTLKLTPSATEQLTSLIENKRKDMPDVFLRIFAAKGCGGIQYGFSFVNEKTPEDVSIAAVSISTNEPISIALLTDKDSTLLIDGATIDFTQDDNTGPRFVVNNPNDQGGGCSSCPGSCG